MKKALSLLFLQIAQFRCLVCCDQAVDDFIQISIQNVIQSVKCKFDTVIGYTSLWKIVGSDLLGTITCTDLASSRLCLCVMLFGQFHLIQT